MAVVVAAVVLLLGGFLLEHTLVHATLDARATLPAAVARATNIHDPDDVRRRVKAGGHDEVAAILSTNAELAPSAETRTLAAHASTAAGLYRDAARHATFAWRLSPDNEALDRQAQDAATLALLGRLRPVARVLALLGLVVLVVALRRRARRRRHRRRTARWLAGLDARVAVGVDGRTFHAPDHVTIPPETQAVRVDVFLRGHPGRRRRPFPRPGPTLAIVLSQAASSLTLRLRPRHDVRDDAVRVRLTDDTLAQLLDAPGAWRLGVHFGGCRVGETVLDVMPRRARRRRRRLRLFAHA